MATTTGSTIRELLGMINRNSSGMAVIVDASQRPVRTVTDGDIRRAILAGAALDIPIGDLPEYFPSQNAVTVELGMSDKDMLALMHERCVQQLPVLDEEGRLTAVVTMQDLVPEAASTLGAVVMAGGFGTRLRPLTSDVPKPMLPIGDRPLLERIVSQLRDSGIREVSLTTHYLPEIIESHFGDGSQFGVNINYVNEETPLGTAGALRLLSSPTYPLLVINGDILTNVDFRRMKEFHEEHDADLTLAVRPHETQIPYGVVETDGALLTSLVEKPTVTHFVNAGIYLLGEHAFDHIGVDGRLDMTQLVDALLADGKRVATFPLTEYWIDIGHISDYEQAQTDFANGVIAL
ncbi:MAG: nucleotidyltransferase family protein [Armatimonadetes bacterium]|nr:nucleotidyltransferase family protein [Armatimonadota bacterium]